MGRSVIFIDKTGETVRVQMPYGRQIFRYSSVKTAPQTPNALNETQRAVVQICNELENEGEMIHMIYGSPDFSTSRKAEIDGLNSRKLFEKVLR